MERAIPSSGPSQQSSQPVVAVLFFWKRNDLTLEQFKAHYEEVHMPLIHFLAGKDFPLSHKRRYVTESNVLFGTKADFPYDAITEIMFADSAHFARFSAIVNEGEAKRLREEDEARFVDMAKMTGIWGLDERVTRASG